jgi:hypothetical protein
LRKVGAVPKRNNKVPDEDEEFKPSRALPD